MSSSYYLLLTIYLSLTIILLLLLLLLFYYHCCYYCYNCCFDWYYRYSYSWEIKLGRVPSKEFKLHGLPLFIKWCISRFRGIYTAPAASAAMLFLILLKGLRSLCNDPQLRVGCCGCSTSPSAFYSYSYCCCCCYCYCIFNITFIVNIIFVISINIRIFIKSSLLFWWGRLNVWFCFLQYLDLS